jgi:hypothetical protein
LLVLTGCAHSTAIVMPLKFTPTDEVRGGLPVASVAALSGKPISVQITGDDRPQPLDLIGRNVQEQTPKPVNTPDDVAAFLRQTVEGILSTNGLQVVPSGGARVLQLRVGSFFVEEANTYKATVAFTAALVDGSGKPLWRGTVNGQSSRWGRSFSAENYLEALSNATLDAMKSMMGAPEFVKAASGQ